MNPPKIRAALIDLSGTLHIGDTPIPGAVEAMHRLCSRIPTLLLTNTTKISSSSLQKQVDEMGFPRCRIMTSTIAARNYVMEKNLTPFLLLEDESDFDHTQSVDPTVEPPPTYNCVVVGLAPSKLEYHHLNQAYHILRNSPDAQLIAIHRADYYRDSSLQLSLGPGGFVTLLEQVSQKEAVVIGKPSPAFFQAALNEFEGIPAHHVCMVGDDVVGDILGAREAEIGTTILVQTGKYQQCDKEKAQTALVVPSIVEAVDYILENVDMDTNETS
jgi:HAD superfamily hydrolase (TIGR01458 family)